MPACASEQLAANTTSVVWFDTCSNAVETAPKSDFSSVTAISGGGISVASVLAIDETDAYFNAANSIVRAPIAGGDSTVLATQQDYLYSVFPNQLAVDNESVYWSQESLLSVPKVGDAPVTTLAAGNLGAHVTTDADYVYWSRVQSIHRQAKADGTDQVLLSNGDLDSINLMPIAVTSSSLFYLDDGAFAMPTSGGSPKLIDGDGTGIAIAADADRAYWAESGQIVAGDADGNVTAIASAVGVLGLAVDDTYVYWDTGGGIFRAAK